MLIQFYQLHILTWVYQPTLLSNSPPIFSMKERHSLQEVYLDHSIYSLGGLLVFLKLEKDWIRC